MTDTNELTVQLLSLQVLAKRVAAAEKATKRELEDRLDEGSKVSGTVMLEGRKFKLGSVSRSSPNGKASVVDRDEFEAYLGHKYFDDVLVDVRIKPDVLPEVFALLRDKGLEDWLEESETVPDWCRKEALRRAEAGADIPGVDVRYPNPVLSGRPGKDADEHVAALIAAGALSVTQLALLPGGE